jgi:ring-1,2-phenylacetyl-CoA epoxidase subunit PaaA
MENAMENTSFGPMTAKSEGRLTVETPEQFRDMPAEYRELLIHQLRGHTEGEIAGADDYVYIFYPMAPNAFERKVCCERAAEEVDHFMKGAAVLADIGVNVEFMLSQSLQERQYYRTDAVRDIRTWAERGVFSWLAEGAVLEMIKEMGESSYRPLADICPSIIKEEHVHVANGYRIVKEMCRTTEGHAQIQAALSRQWPIVLDMFGRTTSERSKKYLHWGLRKYGNEETRQRFIKMVRPKISALELTAPDDMANRKYV